ncbi:MAG TPA: DUF3352 domain-containing protein [Micromonosporaceae bacterium]|nr:DUF3352 domain-containing protein [Micromonosporaceae bacterium]
MTDQYPSAAGSPDPSPWAPQQRPQPDATVPQPGTAHDPWNRDGFTTPAPGPGYQPYPQPTAYEHQQPFNPQAGQPHPFYAGAQQGTAGQPGGYQPYDQNVSYSTLGPAEPAPKPRGRRRALILSVSTVVLLLLGVGAYAAVRAWTGSGNVEPESAMPANVGAFARIDFNPGVRDKLAFDDLVKKFPTGGKSTSDLITSLETRVASSLNLNYDTEVKPWFDGRIGVAVWTGKQGNPVVLLNFASKDDAAAKATMAKLQAKEGSQSLGYVVQDGYALVAGADSNAQQDAEDAAAATRSSSLKDSTEFKSASGHLKGNNLVLIYANLRQLGQLIGTQVPAGAVGGLGGLGGLLGGGGSGANPLSNLNGTIIVGASVVDDGVEIRAHVEGMAGAVNSGQSDARAALDALPETTIVGMALNGLDPNGSSAKSLTQMLDQLLSQSPLGSDGASSQAIAQAATALLTSKVITVALTGLNNGLPSLLVSADTRDADGASLIKQTIDQLLDGANVPGLKVTQDGTHVQATYGNAGSGRLGDDSLYKETMSGMDHVSTALYLNVQQLVSAVGRQAVGSSNLAAIAPLKSVGLGASSSAGGADLLIRVVIK